jgi:phytoene synthase
MDQKKVNEEIFKKASKTYYNSSRFFPPDKREEVFTLYAFVRVADDFVDKVPADPAGFYQFKEEWKKASQGLPTNNPVVEGMANLAKKRGFEPQWTEAFLRSMEWDLSKKEYNNLQETLDYIYGSAEVIGLYMAKILELPVAAFEGARLLGRAMQYINFIRDMDEDRRVLGRRYLPLEDTGLTEISLEEAQRKPASFQKFIDIHTERYLQWQRGAESSYHYLPPSFRWPIMTASDMYVWTVETIQKNPFIVFQRQVKPSKFRVMWTFLLNRLNLGRVRVSKSTSIR